MRYFNFFSFILLIFAAAIPDFLQIAINYAQKHHLLPYQYRSILEQAHTIPWHGLVFGFTFGAMAKFAFPQSTKIRLDEIVGYTLLCPLIQFIAPFAALFASPLLKTISIEPLLVTKFLYASFLAIVARGILGLEALGAGSVIIVGIVGVAVTATGYIPDLPFYPAILWHMFVGGTMAFLTARSMN